MTFVQELFSILAGWNVLYRDPLQVESTIF
jgi:hypothetical protein